MSAIGIPEDEMVVMIINPTTGRAIDAKTLRKTLRPELNQGMTKANVKVIGQLFKGATTKTEQHPYGNPILQMFWAKTRLRWKDRPALFEVPPGTPAPNVDDTDAQSDYEWARRIAYTLSLAAAAGPPKKAAPKPASAKKQPA